MIELWHDIPNIAKAAVALLVLAATIARVYRKRIVPAADALVRVDKAVPVLMGIAEQFTPNGGSSLHDRIVRIEQALAGVMEVVENTESTIEGQERMTIRLLVAMADGFRRLGLPDVIANLPSHVEETDKEL